MSIQIESDESSWEWWYRNYRPKLTRRVSQCAAELNLSDSLVDIEGIVQETFQSAHRSWHRIHSPAGWLNAVARCKLARYTKEAQQRTERDPLDEATAAVSSLRYRTAIDPESWYYVGRIFDAMEKLSSDRQRVAVYAHHVLGYSGPEVAALLDCSPTTARTHTHRGIKAVRNVMAGRDIRPEAPSMPDSHFRTTSNVSGMVKAALVLIGFALLIIFMLSREKLSTGGPGPLPTPAPACTGSQQPTLSPSGAWNCYITDEPDPRQPPTGAPWP